MSRVRAALGDRSNQPTQPAGKPGLRGQWQTTAIRPKSMNGLPPSRPHSSVSRSDTRQDYKFPTQAQLDAASNRRERATSAASNRPSSSASNKIVGYSGHVPGIRDTCAVGFEGSLTGAHAATVLLKGKTRPHSAPSDRWDYESMSGRIGNTNPLGVQTSLKNTSNIRFGDARLWTKSTTQAACFGRKKSPQKLMLSPEKRSELRARTAQYEESKRNVKQERIAAIKNAMQDKIHQKITGGPFQLRRAFKLFDKGASGSVDLVNFRDALTDHFAMDVTEQEITALFAVYDVNMNGALEYREFCNVVMEADFKCVKVW